MTSRGSELERRLAESGVPVHGAPWSIGLDPRALFALLRLIPDSRAILHAHDSHALTLATIATRIRGGRIVATRRVDFHLRRPGQWKRADRVVAISNAVRNVLIADGVSTSRITVVHSGVDLEAARTTPAMDVRSGIRAEPGAILAVSVGALVGHKDHATMVETARLLRPRFPNLHWAVAGDGPERTRLASQIAAAGLTDQFHLLGAIPDGVPLIAAGDVYVASSSEEGLGTSLIDALARGIPVVATDAGGIPELLGDRAGIVCPRGNPQALAVGVERVLADPALARRLREAGPVRAQALSHVRMAEALRSVYRSLDSDA